MGIKDFFNLEKTADISERHQWFPCEMTSEDERGNSTQMTSHEYHPDLGSVSDWPKHCLNRSKALPRSA